MTLLHPCFKEYAFIEGFDLIDPSDTPTPMPTGAPPSTPATGTALALILEGKWLRSVERSYPYALSRRHSLGNHRADLGPEM